MFSPRHAFREMIAQLSACDPERFSRDYHRRREAVASYVLAIAAMTFQHHHWLSSAFVTNRATRASTGKWDCEFGHKILVSVV
jgi:hypothetical protein